MTSDLIIEHLNHQCYVLHRFDFNLKYLTKLGNNFQNEWKFDVKWKKNYNFNNKYIIIILNRKLNIETGGFDIFGKIDVLVPGDKAKKRSF